MNKNINNIVIITDANYAVPARTLCNSILKNSINSCIKINILGIELLEEDIKKFKQLSSQINIISMEDNFKTLNFQHQYVSKASLYKFLLPKIFPGIDKILYLDCDILVLKNINSVFSIDINNVYAAVVKDMPAMYSMKLHIQMELNNYFNSGVMLLNLEKMRKDFISEKLIKLKKEKKFQRYFMDQNELNYIFGDKVNYISPKYNFMSSIGHYEINEIASFYELKYDEAKEIYDNPVIWHLTGHPKIWNQVDSEDFLKWYQYLPEFDYFIHLQNFNKFMKEQIKQITTSKTWKIAKSLQTIKNKLKIKGV